MSNIVRTVLNLKPDQVKELYSVLLEAAIAHQTSGKHSEIFRRAKHRKVGVMRRIYEQLEHQDYAAIERMSAALAEVDL